MPKDDIPEDPQGQEAHEPEAVDVAKTFSQADLDRIVSERVARERAKYADYEDIKAKLEGAKTAEDRVADLEARLSAADAREQHAFLVAKVAKANGIVDPDDLALLQGMENSDEAALSVLAERLAPVEDEPRSYVPTEGGHPQSAGSGDRDFVRQLFGTID